MNFLDAHKIVHDYSGAVGRGADKDALMFRPISYLPTDKDKIIDAFKIFFAHMILFNTRTQEQYEQYYTCLSILKWFVKDEYYETVIEFVSNGGDQLTEAMEYFSDIMEEPSYRLEEVEDYFDKMIDDREELLQYYKDGDVTSQNLVYNYCLDAYKFANIDWNDGYEYYFMSFDVLRKMIDNEKYKSHFKMYCDYILNNQ
ncbi:MAG: hypothetical protein ACOX5F_06130 [Anaerovoracaceae bacterium]|jgi:hypothetical protein